MYDAYPYESAATDAATPLPIMMWLIAIVLLLGLYHAFMQYKIAQLTGPASKAWWAFIPIMNTLLLIKMAYKPMHWFVYLLIPGVNIVMFFILWYQAAENSGKSGVWGILAMLPPLSMIALFVLAFGNRPYVYPDMWTPDAPSQQPPTQPRTPQSVG